MKSESLDLRPETENALHTALSTISPEMTIGEIKELLEVNKNGSVRNSLTNLEMILSNDPLLKGGIRYNELTQRVDLVREMGWHRKSSGTALTDIDFYNIHLYCNKTYGINQTKVIDEAVQIVAHENAYHPIRDYLNSLQWDGTPRVRYAMRKYLGADDSDYTYEILKLFMLGAISRVFQPGIKFDYMICVVGDQGAGKSSFFRLLAVQDEWFSDDIKDLDSGKVFEKLQGYWIIEMSEMLATNNAKSNELIKSFLSRQKETYRTPYGRYAEDRLRQCVFAGTTNKLHFLPNDRTGHRRFLPIRCSERNAEKFILDNEKESRAYIKQMWAEVMEEYRHGNVKLKLSKEMAREVLRRQSDFMQEDVDAGLILSYMEDFKGTMVCSKQLFREALHNGDISPARWQITDVNEIMNKMIKEGTLEGWRYFDSPRRFHNDYGTQKGWERIPDSQNVNEPTSTEPEFRQIRLEDEIPFQE